MTNNDLPVLTVYRGSGTAVHAAIVLDGKIAGTVCVFSPNAGSRSDSRLRPSGEAVTCKRCNTYAPSSGARTVATVAELVEAERDLAPRSIAAARAARPLRTVKVDDDVWSGAQARAGREDRSVSEVIRHALDAYARGYDVVDLSMWAPPVGFDADQQADAMAAGLARGKARKAAGSQA